MINSPKNEDLNESTKKSNLTEDVRGGENIQDKQIKKTLWIIGGKRCVNIGTKIMKSRSKSLYEDYKVFSVTKPFASTKEITKILQLF